MRHCIHMLQCWTALSCGKSWLHYLTSHYIACTVLVLKQDWVNYLFKLTYKCHLPMCYVQVSCASCAHLSCVLCAGQLRKLCTLTYVLCAGQLRKLCTLTCVLCAGQLRKLCTLTYVLCAGQLRKLCTLKVDQNRLVQLTPAIGK